MISFPGKINFQIIFYPGSLFVRFLTGMQFCQVPHLYFFIAGCCFCPVPARIKTNKSVTFFICLR